MTMSLSIFPEYTDQHGNVIDFDTLAGEIYPVDPWMIDEGYDVIRETAVLLVSHGVTVFDSASHAHGEVFDCEGNELTRGAASFDGYSAEQLAAIRELVESGTIEP